MKCDWIWISWYEQLGVVYPGINYKIGHCRVLFFHPPSLSISTSSEGKRAFLLGRAAVFHIQIVARSDFQFQRDAQDKLWVYVGMKLRAQGLLSHGLWKENLGVSSRSRPHCCSGCPCPASRSAAIQPWSTLCLQSRALRVPELGTVGLQFLLQVLQRIVWDHTGVPVPSKCASLLHSNSLKSTGMSCLPALRLQDKNVNIDGGVGWSGVEGSLLWYFLQETIQFCRRVKLSCVVWKYPECTGMEDPTVTFRVTGASFSFRRQAAVYLSGRGCQVFLECRFWQKAFRNDSGEQLCYRGPECPGAKPGL